VGKGGVVRDEKDRLEAIDGIARAAVNLGLTVLGGVDSAVHGPKGNVEHLLWMRSASA
jgi:23S rRNA (cytidine1920-2'-O)/16S rRNA (cytidine1409-2'-O)-methyltransferase